MFATTLDVIEIYDQTIRPPGPKMVICIDPETGYFFRINTQDCWHDSVPLPRLPNHQFLAYDSHVECGSILELDEYLVDESVRAQGILGQISPEAARIIKAKALDSRLTGC